MAHLWSNSAAWMTVGFLALCAITDVLYRRVSETAIVFFSLAVLIDQFSWVSVASGLLCAGLWWVSDRRNAALGDIEMAVLTGLGLGPFSLITIAVSCLLALATKPWWPRLSSRHTPPGERHLAPMGLYLAVGALVTVLMVPWLIRGEWLRA
ncbi:hypothetical protein [Alicyclobacillus macrosporangiidus]|uniref:hypothetical protein n=1 Tax=Alicyclobacillus macrosporangiidus TaxID=392015 RepID=UPI00049635E7|nr:hypothetical protein [Alicyclobacillus macrosporangiidus]